MVFRGVIMTAAANTQAPTIRMPIAGAALTPSARGAGRATFGLVGALVLFLKLYEFGAETQWAFLGDFDFLLSDMSRVHWDQWARVLIIVLEAAATAAVISIAVTYVVINANINNSTTNNNSTTTVTHINGQDVGQLVSAISVQLAEIRDRVSAFESHLVRTEEAERARIQEALAFAESERNKKQAEQLQADRDMLGSISEALKSIVATISKQP
jgi:hypothetical protein